MKKMLEDNSAVGFWLFIFVVAVSIVGLNNTIWSEYDGNLVAHGTYFVSFFLFLAGYLLMVDFKNDKKTKASASVSAWNYTKKVFRILYPALLGGVLLAFIIKNVIASTPIMEILDSFVNSIFEFLGLSQAFLSADNIIIWNEPLWLFSAIIISSFILRFIVSKSEDLFRFFAIIFAIIVYGGMHLNIINQSIGLLNATAAMGLGMLLYYVVDFFKGKKFSEVLTMGLSIIHIGLAMTFIYVIVNGANWNELSFSLLLYIFLAILLINNDYIAVLYNKFSLGSYLGRFSIYYYSCFIAFVVLLGFLFPEMSYLVSIIFNILFISCWSFIMMYFDDYVVDPIINSKLFIKTKKIAKR